MEWSKKNEFNSFNSWKGLLYAPWYRAIHDKDFLPPIEASLDPIHACNLSCSHCNAYRYIKDGVNKMPDEHLIRLVRFLGKWGVKAICFGGGGEPSMHGKLADAIREAKKGLMHTAVATNGTIMPDDLIDAMTRCRWVGVSIDAATEKTYEEGRAANLFFTALRNIGRLLEAIKISKSDCEVSYKFLIMPHNQHEIYDACIIAKELGVRDFHARPADFAHQGMGELKVKHNAFNVDIIKEQFEQCHRLETEDFRVFTVTHKFNGGFLPRKDFSQCYAAPCCIQLCADGHVYLCPDQRHVEAYKLGSHYPDPSMIKRFWGGDNHKKLVYEVGKSMCSTRCTFAPYNKQCEELFIKQNDSMSWRFI